MYVDAKSQCVRHLGTGRSMREDNYTVGRSPDQSRSWRQLALQTLPEFILTCWLSCTERQSSSETDLDKGFILNLQLLRAS